jgi:hypothetical protein
MPVVKPEIPSPDRLTFVKKRAIKALLVGFSCVAGLAIVTMVQMTVDQTSDVYSEQTVASSALLGP